MIDLTCGKNDDSCIAGSPPCTHQRDSSKVALATEVSALAPVLTRAHQSLVMLLAISVVSMLQSAEAPSIDRKGFTAHVKPFLNKHCISCHGRTQQKAGLRYDTFDGDMLKDQSADIWQEAIHLIEGGEMPPPDTSQPSTQESKPVIKWLNAEIDRVRQARLQQGAQISLRRMSNLEYRQAVQDLLQTPIDVPNELKFINDTRIDGFENFSASLDLSSFHLKQFLRAAEHIADRIINVPEQQPKKEHWTIIINEKGGGRVDHFSQGINNGHFGKKKDKIKKGRIPLGSRGSKGKRTLYGPLRFHDDFNVGRVPYTMIEHTDKGPVHYEGYSDIRVYGMVPVRSKTGGGAFLGWRWLGYDEGWYRSTIKVTAYKDPRLDRPDPILRVLRNPDNKLLGKHKISIGQEREFSFMDYFPDVRSLFAIKGDRYLGYRFTMSASGRTYDRKYMPKDLPKSQRNNYLKRGLIYGIGIKSIEIEGPLFKSWPPPLVTSVFPAKGPKQTQSQYAVKCLTDFANRAWRRPPTSKEIQRLTDLYQQNATKDKSVRKASRDALIYILSSPHFYCVKRGQRTGNESQYLASHDLANRLALFLWRSIPDPALREVADNGTIVDSKTLHAQAKRMLADKRIDVFCQDLADRWFNLEAIKDVTVSQKLYKLPRGNKSFMIKETRMFLTEIIKNNMSAFELIDSNWTFANSWLAKHYGIPGVTDEHMHRVALDKTHQRGGVLAHASIHTITSNGMRTSPIHRGMFILEHILGTKPPPPAPNVPALEEAKGASENATVRELLEVHRKQPQCAGCHARIDPLGFALEGYDAVGRTRSHEIHLADGKITQGHAVDVSGQLPDGRSFSGLSGLKQIILQDGDKFRRCVIKKLLAYALDREPNFMDEPLIEELIQGMRNSDDRMQDLIIAIISSPTFRKR